MKHRSSALALFSLKWALLVFLCCQINYAIAAAAHSNYSVVPTEAVGSIVSLNTSATPAPTAPLKLTFALNSASQSAIADYVNSLTDPTSPNYHHWLTPQQFGGLFGPSSADISTVVAYLSKLGLTNITVWPDHMFVTASTTKQQAEAAFGVSISGYSRSSADVARGLSKTYYAPNKLPLIDSSVALHITAIFGLSSAVQAIPVGSLTGVAHPDASASGCFDPIDLSNAYNTTPLHKSGLLGKGQTIAIFSPTEFTQSDITRFATANGITSPIVNIVKVTGQNGVSGATDYDAQVEACIDIETVLGQAPAATVNVYESPNDGGFEIFQQVEKDDPNILTESYGIDENEVNQSYASAYETIRQALSAEGVTIFVASGDTGAFDGYNQSTVTVSVDSSSAYVTAVGGTELSALNAGAWNGEKAWTYKDGTTSGNSGSSGGISIYFPMPTWQTGTGVTTKYSDGMRQVPDVAALASTPYYDISVEGGWYGFGGTSCASPLWAGAISLIEESMGTRLGNINPKLYALAATAAPPFHDITSGNDGLYSCTPGWDYVTGWGSADFSKLLTGFGGVPPTITSFTPATGGPGTAVTIVGTNLASASSITFGGAAATTITSDTATQIVVQVPTAAVTGPITITTPQGSVTSKTNFTVTPAFMLSSSAGSLSVADNKTGTTTITLTNGTAVPTSVALTVSGLPANVTAAFLPTSIKSGTTSVLTFTAGNTAVAGTYPITVTGTATQGVASTTLSLTITSVPVLTSISVTSSVASILSGATAQFTAIAKDQFGSALATQPTFTWTTSGGGTISTSGLFTAKTSDGPFTVTAKSGTVSGTGSITITAGPTFTLAASPTALSIKQGGSGAFSITITPLNGFSGGINVGITGIPSTIAVAFSSSGPVATLTLTAPTTTPVGTNTVTITGVSGSITSSATVALTITAVPVLASVKVTPATATLIAGATQQFSAIAYDQNGNAMSPQPTLTWTESGGGTIAANGLFTSTTAGGPFTITAASASSATAAGVKGTATVTVTPAPSFSLTASPTSVSILDGATGKSTVSLVGTNGFSSAATLSVTGLPTGVTAAFATATLSGTATDAVTFTAATTAAAGTYNVVVTGTSGLKTESVTIAVTIVKSQILTSIKVSPATETIVFGGTQQFTAVAYDQFGVIMVTQPAITWTTSGGGTIAVAGLFTSTTAGGPFTITAAATAATGTTVGVKGTASVTVSPAPSFSLTASPTTVNVNEGSTGKSTISLVGANGFASTASLVISGVPSGVTASLATTTIAGTATDVVTFTAGATAVAGTSTVTITGTSGKLTSTITISVTVIKVQFLTSATLTPSGVVLVYKGTQTYTAKGFDQFGVAMVTQPTFTWSIPSTVASAVLGTISTSGGFTAGSVAGIATVQAASGNIVGTTTVKVEAAPAASGLTLSSASVTGGTTVTGTVAINEAAPTGGVTVSLGTSNGKTAVPATSVTVAAGATTAAFSIITVKPSTSTTVTISAAAGGTTQSASLKVN